MAGLHVENHSIFNGTSLASGNSDVKYGARNKLGYTYTLAWTFATAITALLKLRGADSQPQGFVAGVIADIQPLAAECTPLPTGVTLANGGIQLTAVGASGVVMVRSNTPLPTAFRWEWTLSAGTGTLWLDAQTHGLV